MKRGIRQPPLEANARCGVSRPLTGQGVTQLFTAWSSRGYTLSMVKDEVLGIIKEASLSSSQVGLWERVVKELPEGVLGNILDFLQRNPDNGAIFLTNNLEEKIKALGSSDMIKWEEILKGEKENLKNFK